MVLTFNDIRQPNSQIKAKLDRSFRLHHFQQSPTAIKVFSVSYIAILQKNQSIEKHESPEELFIPVIKPMGS